jgi:hypothetical protein
LLYKKIISISKRGGPMVSMLLEGLSEGFNVLLRRTSQKLFAVRGGLSAIVIDIKAIP